MAVQRFVTLALAGFGAVAGPVLPRWRAARTAPRRRPSARPAAVVVFAAASARESSTEVDAGVLARARAGDARAFADVVRHYDARLRALAFRLLDDAGRMDDALQEAYVKAFRALPGFKGESSLGTWLYRITYNVCLDDLRRRRKVVSLSEAQAAETAATEADPADIGVQRRDLAAALAALAPDHRTAVLLVDAQGMDYAEAAHVLGVAEGTVASRLSRARAQLRRALEVRD